MSGMLKIYLFGSPRLEQDTQPISLYRRRRSVAILAYLAQSQRLHSREKLVTLFWPEEDPTRARANLRRDLFFLRQNLPDELLNVSRSQVGLNLNSPIWVDTLVFQAHLNAVHAHQHEAGLLCATCLQALTEAVALYQEDFLTGFSLPDAPEFDEWCYFQGESLRHSLVEALQLLVTWYEQQRDYTLALPYAQRWLSLDALNEAVHRLLMKLYAQSGQQAAALQQYKKCAALLAEELAVTPEPETDALHEAIQMRQWHMPPLPESARPTNIVPTEQLMPAQPAAPFVAREGELERLHQALDEAMNGRFQTLFLTGEAGQGKTALLQAFTHQAVAAHPSLAVASGSCNAYTGSGDPFFPFRDVLNFLTGDRQAAALIPPSAAHPRSSLLPIVVPAILHHAPDLIGTLLAARPLAQRLATLVPERPLWVQQVETAVQHSEQSKTQDGLQIQQAALLEQYAKVMQSIAQQRPLLLLLDDVQWVDSGSAALLHHLGRRLVGFPVMLVVAYRPSDVALDRSDMPHPLRQIIYEFQRSFGDITLDLGQAGGEPFVAALLAQEPHALPADFQATLYQQTSGHPLFTLELLRDMQARGDLVKDEEGRWITPSRIDWERLPARVEGAIGERIRRLNGSQREILQTASVVGEWFSAELVAAALNLNGRFVQTQLSQELDKKHQLVQAVDVQQSAGVRLARYRFRHILIQRYLYDSLDEAERVYHHEALGNALEQLFAADTSSVAVELARHFETAVIPHKSRRYLEQAGDQARQAIALDQAAHYYRQALTYTNENAVAETAVLQRKLAETLWVLGQVPEARRLFEAALASVMRLEDAKAMGIIHRHLGRMNWELHDRTAALTHYQQSLALLEQFPDSVELAWTLSGISQIHMLGSNYKVAMEWGGRALALADRLQATAVRVHALNNVGTAQNRIEKGSGDAMLQESIRLGKTLRLPHDTGRAYHNLMVSFRNQYRHDELNATIDEAYAYAEQTQTEIFLIGAAVLRMIVAWDQGAWRKSLAQLAEIQQWLAEREAVALNPITVGTFAAQVANSCGQPKAALAELAIVKPLVTGLDAPDMLLSFYNQIARAQWLAKQPTPEIKDTFDQMLAIWQRPDKMLSSVYWCLTIVEWRLAQGDAQSLEQVNEMLDILESLADRSPENQAIYFESLGRLALQKDQIVSAVPALAQAVIAWATSGLVYDEMRAAHYYGQALLTADQPAKAAEAHERAHQIGKGLAAELDNPEMKAAFLQTPLLKAIARQERP
ncbi:ATP-binding protein [Candidatus Leptofilum sp.]|uniref:ATP-binding protein n=1 Tax=Candidatus Leptofilum sp. TaxID=3241576 RepID=UPI003B5C873F